MFIPNNGYLQGKPAPSTEVISPAIPKLCSMIESPIDTKILEEALWGLKYISEDQVEVLCTIESTGVLPKIIQYMLHPSKTVVSPAMRIVGNYCTSEDRFTDVRLFAYFHHIF